MSIAANERINKSMGLNHHLSSQSEPSVTLYGTESEESTKKSSPLKGTPKACDVKPAPNWCAL